MLTFFHINFGIFSRATRGQLQGTDCLPEAELCNVLFTGQKNAFKL